MTAAFEYVFVSTMYPDNAGRDHMTDYAQSFLVRAKRAVLIDVTKSGELFLYRFEVREIKRGEPIGGG